MAAEQRAVVMRASVIGQRFDLFVLLATATDSEADVRTALELACRLDLVEADEPPRERFRFRHALTRDIIYSELQRLHVRSIHRRIARALELAPHSVSLGELAYHTWAAGDARRSLRYNELAGDDAAAIHANDDARVYYSRAQSLVAVDSGAFLRLSRKIESVGE
jgi:predicted ATPase